MLVVNLQSALFLKKSLNLKPELMQRPAPDERSKTTDPVAATDMLLIKESPFDANESTKMKVVMKELHVYWNVLMSFRLPP